MRVVGKTLTARWSRWSTNAHIVKEESKESLAWDLHLMAKDGIIHMKRRDGIVIVVTKETATVAMNA